MPAKANGAVSILSMSAIRTDDFPQRFIPRELVWTMLQFSTVQGQKAWNIYRFLCRNFSTWFLLITYQSVTF